MRPTTTDRRPPRPSVDGAAPHAAPPAARARALLACVRGALRTVIGAPDYERYVAHVCAHHPERAPLDRAAFERERLAARYDRPGSRCC